MTTAARSFLQVFIKDLLLLSSASLEEGFQGKVFYIIKKYFYIIKSILYYDFTGINVLLIPNK